MCTHIGEFDGDPRVDSAQNDDYDQIDASGRNRSH